MKYGWLLVGVLALLGLGYLQFSTPYIIDKDGYVHSTYSLTYDTHMVYSSYVDLNILYHLLLFPFVVFDPMTGAKVSAMVFSLLFTLTLYFLLKKQEVLFPELWALSMFFATYMFLFRLSQPKAFPLGLCLLLLSYYCIRENKSFFLGVTSFVFVYVYPAFPLVLLLLILHSFMYNKISLSLYKSYFIGVIAAIIFNPFFPKNIKILFYQIFGNIFLPSSELAGTEWSAFPSFFSFIEVTWPLLLLVLTGIFFYLSFPKEKETLYFLILTLFFALAAYSSKRFVEYFVPFATLFIAISFSSFLKKRYENNFFVFFTKKITKRAVLAILMLFLLFPAYQTISYAKENIYINIETKKPYAFQQCAEWLAQHTEEGEIIFSHWADYPVLYFYNQHNRYIVGFDPMFLYVYDKNLFYVYENLLLSKQPNPKIMLQKKFNTKKVMSPTYRKEFIAYLLNNGFKPVYQDKYCVLLE
ncbi:hypothetical protein J4410_00090 [Candidatus Woesearchaeota archaeon]|nr:hypothetical protein [Candidatus Woesearchaeota archaeon]